MKAIFFGTPGLAVPFLELTARRTALQAVITSPDQPAGRGYALKSPDVKTAAHALAVPVLQPASLRDAHVIEPLCAFHADIGIVVAYGHLLPKDVLAVPKHGFLNVHFSLLPKYRGAAPIQWALIRGERETGVTLFWLDEGMDTGPIFLQKRLAIRPDDDADALRKGLVVLGVTALEEALSLIDQGRIARTPQSGESSLAPMLKKEDGHLSWEDDAETLLNRIRGTTPWPGAFCLLSQPMAQRLKILRAQPADASGPMAEPGQVVRLVSGEGVVVRCGRGELELRQVQPEGKKAMSAWDWWQGARLKLGDKLR